MSDSELSDAPSAPPDNATLESSLRRVVRDAIKSGDEITVRIARTRAEEELGLDTDFFKQDDWKERSKEIISAAVDEPESPVKPKPKAGRKRKSEEPVEKPKKRARKSPVVESEDDDMLDEDQEEEDEDEEEEKPQPKHKPKSKAKPPHKPKAKPKSKAKTKAESPVIDSNEDEEDEEPTTKPNLSTKKETTIDSDAEDEPTSKPASKSQSPAPEKEEPAPADSDNESEMSILIDDPPPKKKAPRQPKKSTSPGAATKPTKKSTTAASKDLSPDDEEIKRLQSWLLKCGIRKLWHRELAPFSTPKAKIAHLKGMLTDAGMTGRFSAEKAKSIKEARELKEELDAAKDFEEKFGTGGRGRRAKKNVNLKEDQGSGDDGEDGEQEEDQLEGAKRPGGRLLPKGLVDFGDSGDDGSD